MTTQSFGSLLREFRMKTHNLNTKKPLTQQELGQILYEEIGLDIVVRQSVIGNATSLNFMQMNIIY